METNKTIKTGVINCGAIPCHTFTGDQLAETNLTPAGSANDFICAIMRDVLLTMRNRVCDERCPPECVAPIARAICEMSKQYRVLAG